MKRLFIYLLGVFSFLLLSMNVNAKACTSKELADLQREAGNIKVNHELVRETKTTHLYDFFDNELPETVQHTDTNIKINLYNLTKNLFIVESVKDYNNYDNEIVLYGSPRSSLEFVNERTINYKDTSNGNYTITLNKLNHYIDYKFEIYNNSDICDTTLLKTVTYRKPKYNEYFEESICKEYPNVSYCAEFITKDIDLGNKTLEEAVKLEAKNNGYEKQNEDEKPGEEAVNFLGKNLKYFIIAGSIIVVGIIGYGMINKRRGRI